MTILSRRADFLAANRGKRRVTDGFILLLRDRADGADDARVGFTVTKKIGNAVVRNRMKRRFRALARDVLATHARVGHDHILIGRAGGIDRNFAALRADLLRAVTR